MCDGIAQLAGLSEGATSKVMPSKPLTPEKEEGVPRLSPSPTIPSSGLEKSPGNQYSGGGLETGEAGQVLESQQLHRNLHLQPLPLALPLRHARG